MSEDDVIHTETDPKKSESTAGKNNLAQPIFFSETHYLTTFDNQILPATTSLKDDEVAPTANKNLPDNDLTFFEEVHHNRLKRNVDNLKSPEVTAILDITFFHVFLRRD